MGKVLLVLLVVVAVALYIPESRAVVLDGLSPVVDPFHEWRTQQEMSRMINDLEAERDVRAGFPAGDEAFMRWIGRRYSHENAEMDAWGSIYRLEVARDSFHVVSAGRDGEFGTDRDLRMGGVNPGR